MALELLKELIKAISIDSINVMPLWQQFKRTVKNMAFVDPAILTYMSEDLRYVRSKSDIGGKMVLQIFGIAYYLEHMRKTKITEKIDVINISTNEQLIQWIHYVMSMNPADKSQYVENLSVDNLEEPFRSIIEGIKSVII